MKKQHLLALAIFASLLTWMVIPRENNFDTQSASIESPVSRVISATDGISVLENNDGLSVRAESIAQRGTSSSFVLEVVRKPSGM